MARKLALLGCVVVGVLAVGCGRERSQGSVEVGTSRSALYLGTAVKWPTPGNIPVCWETGGFEQEKALVQEGIRASWEVADPAVRFTGWGPCAATSAGIRIVIEQTQEGPHTKGLGKELAGMAQGMSLDFALNDEFYGQKCQESPAMHSRCIVSIANHEFGHALGFMHEQERPDTPDTCEFKEVATDAEFQLKTVGAWDLMSIMNYCFPDRDNVYPTSLSPTDIAGLKEMYPPGLATTPPPGTDAGAGPGVPDKTKPSKATKPASTSAGDDDDDDDGDRRAKDDDDDDKPKKKKAGSSSEASPQAASCSAAPGRRAPISGALGIVLAAAVAISRRSSRRASRRPSRA